VRGQRRLRRKFRPLSLDNLADQAEASPTITVLSAWAYVEAAINYVADQVGFRDIPRLANRADMVIGELGGLGALPSPDNTRSVVQKLLGLRREAQVGAPVSKLEACDYAATGLQIIGTLLDAYQNVSRRTEPAPADGSG
jgi:hypothetical protein